MGNKPYISIVIPNRNRAVDVCELLHSISVQAYRDFETIVVDDFSTDDSIKVIAGRFPWVTIIPLPDNRGPARARNAGIRQAAGEIILGLDSDTLLPDDSTLERVASLFIVRPQCHCAAFRLINNATGVDDVLRWWHPAKIEARCDAEFSTDYFSGTAYAFRRSVFDKAGYFPEDLFMDMEENDLALRIIEAGYEILYYPEVRVIHKASPTGRNNNIRFYYKRRNQLWVYAGYYPWYLSITSIVPRYCLTFLYAVKHRQVSSVVRSLRDGLRGLSAAVKNRHKLSAVTRRRLRQIRKNACSLHHIRNDVSTSDRKK